MASRTYSAIGRIGFKDLRICDGGAHEIELITNGTMAYAVCNGLEAEVITREGPVIEVSCSAVDRHEEVCPGNAKFDLSRESAWGPGWGILGWDDWITLTHSTVAMDRHDAEV